MVADSDMKALLIVHALMLQEIERSKLKIGILNTITRGCWRAYSKFSLVKENLEFLNAVRYSHAG